MAELNSLSDRELRAKLQQYGIDATITATTRSLFIRKLKAAIEESSNGNSHDEPVDNRPSSMRRRSAVKSKSRQRNSIASLPSRDLKNDDSDDEVMNTSVVKKSVKHKSPEKVSIQNGSKDANISHSNDHISNEELVKQLAKYNIPCPGITQSTRPILIKKLNHAVAKSRRESKVFSPPQPQASFSRTYNDEEEDSEKDSPDNGSNCSLTFSSFHGISPTVRTPTTSKPELQFSKQHSLTMGHCTPLDSKSKLNTSDASNIFIPSPSVVVNRFVEEQEPSPYDTGSDSEADKKTTKSPGVQKRNWAIPSWLSKKVHPTVQSVPVKKSSLSQSLKRKLNIIWQWQFIAIVLPLLAVLFFLILGAVYLRATYNDQQDSKMDRAVQPTFLDPILEQAITHIKLLLEKESMERICNGNGGTSVDSKALMEQLKINSTALDLIKTTVEGNPKLGIIITGDTWDIPPLRLPLWCSIKSFLWNLVMFVVFAFVAFGVGIMCYYYVMSTSRKREKEEQEIYLMVKTIIDLLARNHASKMADRRPQDAFLAVIHVRDSIIPLEDRKSKLKLWNKAVQYLEDNESRVRAEMQQIEGEDYRVWRWLPPSMMYGNQGLVSSASVDHSVDETGPGVSTVSAQRPKVWQGQAFSTGSSGVNAPPPYPLTQCLKVRNMFEAEVELGDSWPVRIQDAVLEKAEGAKILHLAVDKASREGCVYIKCTSNEDAGKVYRALHGWWFDGNLVTVKYLRPERYHYRFPDSLEANVPLQPSNDKRLSLQTKFWKSPLEYF